MIWYSVDGLRWHSVPTPASVKGAPRDVADTGDGFPGVGNNDRRQLLWTSPDGRARTLSAFPGPVPYRPDTGLGEVSNVDGRLVLNPGTSRACTTRTDLGALRSRQAARTHVAQGSPDRSDTREG